MCKRLEFLIQVFNVGKIKFGNSWLILPTTKFSFMPIFSAIQYLTRLVESKYYQEFVIGQESIELPYRL